MIYGMSNFKIRKLPEKMISINFLSINADYVSIFIQDSEAGLLFLLKWLCRERERERERREREREREREQARREAQALEVYNLCNLRLGNELGNLLENRKSRRLDQYSSTKGFYSSRSN